MQHTQRRTGAPTSRVEGELDDHEVFLRMLPVFEAGMASEV